MGKWTSGFWLLNVQELKNAVTTVGIHLTQQECGLDVGCGETGQSPVALGGAGHWQGGERFSNNTGEVEGSGSQDLRGIREVL